MKEPPRNIAQAFVLVCRQGKLSYFVLLLYLYGLLGDFAWYYLVLGLPVLLWFGHDVRKLFIPNRNQPGRAFEVIVRPTSEDI